VVDETSGTSKNIQTLTLLQQTDGATYSIPSDFGTAVMSDLNGGFRDLYEHETTGIVIGHG
jgi:hypothetical protein